MNPCHPALAAIAAAMALAPTSLNAQTVQTAPDTASLPVIIPPSASATPPAAVSAPIFQPTQIAPPVAPVTLDPPVTPAAPAAIAADDAPPAPVKKAQPKAKAPAASTKAAATDATAKPASAPSPAVAASDVKNTQADATSGNASADMAMATAASPAPAAPMAIPVPPPVPQQPDEADGNAIIPLAAVGGGILVLAAGGGLLLTRRKRRKAAANAVNPDYVVPPYPESPNESVFAQAPVAADPVMPMGMTHPSSQPMASALPAGFDLSRFGPNVQAAYRGPTPDNPSLSLSRRLKRARFFDKRERMMREKFPMDSTASSRNPLNAFEIDGAPAKDSGITVRPVFQR